MGTCVPFPAAAKSAMDIVFLTIAASYPGNQTRRGTYPLMPVACRMLEN